MSHYSSESDSLDIISGKGGKEHHRHHLRDGKVIVDERKLSSNEHHRHSSDANEDKRKNSGESDPKKRKIYPVGEHRKKGKDDIYFPEEPKPKQDRRDSLNSNKEKTKSDPQNKVENHRRKYHHRHHRRHYKKLFHPPFDKNVEDCPTERGPLLVDDTTSISRILQLSTSSPTDNNGIINCPNEKKVDSVINPNEEDKVVATERKMRKSAGSFVTFGVLQDDMKYVDDDACPFCGKGKFRKKFTWTGIIAALFCFPCGIICCIKFRAKICSFCGVRMDF